MRINQVKLILILIIFLLMQSSAVEAASKVLSMQLATSDSDCSCTSPGLACISYVQGGFVPVVQAAVTATVGMILLGSAMEGYLIGLGDLRKGAVSLILRGLLIAAGIFLSLPGWKYDLTGFGIAIVALGLMMLTLRLQVREGAVQP